MVSADNGTGHVDYAYDALGRRVSRDDGTISTAFTYDGQDVLMDDDSVTGVSTYQNGLGIDNKLKVNNASSSSYFLAGHLGSTNALTDASGSVTASNSYDSFGNATNTSFTSRYQFTGRELDAFTGLQYNRARWYDSAIGRFISEDPIGFKGRDVNLYAYVWNDPVKLADPNGTDGGATLVLGGGAALGAARGSSGVGAAIASAAPPVAIAVGTAAAWYGAWQVGEALANSPSNPFVNGPWNPFGTPYPAIPPLPGSLRSPVTASGPTCQPIPRAIPWTRSPSIPIPMSPPGDDPNGCEAQLSADNAICDRIADPSMRRACRSHAMERGKRVRPTFLMIRLALVCQ